MLISIDGKKTHEGTLVIDPKTPINFHVVARGNLDVFFMKTCNRVDTMEKSWNVTKKVKTGIFGWFTKKITLKNQVKFKFYPNRLELDPDCYFEFAAFDEKGRHSWANFVFRHAMYKADAYMECNGHMAWEKSKYICQGMKGTKHRIIFREPMIVASSAQCAMPKKSGKSFLFTMKKGTNEGVCQYEFESIKKPVKRFKLLTLGFDAIPLRRI